jgi:hypothetical protein
VIQGLYENEARRQGGQFAPDARYPGGQDAAGLAFVVFARRGLYFAGVGVGVFLLLRMGNRGICLGC